MIIADHNHDCVKIFITGYEELELPIGKTDQNSPKILPCHPVTKARCVGITQVSDAK